MNSIASIANTLETLSVDHSSRLWSQYTTGFDFGVNEAQQKGQ